MQLRPYVALKPKILPGPYRKSLPIPVIEDGKR